MFTSLLIPSHLLQRPYKNVPLSQSLPPSLTIAASYSVFTSFVRFSFLRCVKETATTLEEEEIEDFSSIISFIAAHVRSSQNVQTIKTDFIPQRIAQLQEIIVNVQVGRQQFQIILKGNSISMDYPRYPSS